jgi:hypothetical protein
VKHYLFLFGTLQEYTPRLFDLFLERNSEVLAEISTNPRHIMKNGAKCVCLHIDDMLKDIHKQTKV